MAFSKQANVLPSTQTSLRDPYFSKAEESNATDKARVLSASQLKDSEVLIPSVQDIKKLQKILYENLREAMSNRKSVDQALADAEKVWNQTVGG